MSAAPTAVPTEARLSGDPFAPGLLIDGRYTLIGRIGRGGTCTMWHARDEILRRDVAVKRLVGNPTWTPEQAEAARNRAEREGRVAARLHHPRLAAIYDLTEVDGEVCLVMEYIDAPSLAQLIDDAGPLQVADAARMGAQVAEGLAAAHAAGVLHRDVKPANVLVGAGGATLTDFGVARLAGDPSATDTGLITGTPHFMAPEVARGTVAGSASDVYSLGATLFAAVEGQPPTGEGQNALETLRRVAAGRTVAAHRAGPLTPVLARLLDADPAARPSIGEVPDLLRAAAGTLTPTESVAQVTGPVRAAYRPTAPVPAATAKPATLVTALPSVLPSTGPADALWTTPVAAAATPRRERRRRIAMGSLLGAAGVAGVLGGVVAVTTTAVTTPVASTHTALPAPRVAAPVVPPAAPPSAPPIVPPSDSPALDVGLGAPAPSLAAQADPPPVTRDGGSSGSSDDSGGSSRSGSFDNPFSDGFMGGGSFGDDDSDHRHDRGDDGDDGGGRHGSHNRGHGHGKDHGADQGKDHHGGHGSDDDDD